MNFDFHAGYSENDVIKIIINFISKQFPKKCGSCGKIYTSLADYLNGTTHVGKPISYDAEYEEWMPKKPIGSISVSNCQCGSSMTLSSKGMNLFILWRLMHWAKKESKVRSIHISDVLENLRKKVDKCVLQQEKLGSNSFPKVFELKQNLLG